MSTKALPDSEDYVAILIYNERVNDCTCWAYDALTCIAVAEGLDRDIADARYGPCDCTCHEQYKQQKERNDQSLTP